MKGTVRATVKGQNASLPTPSLPQQTESQIHSVPLFFPPFSMAQDSHRNAFFETTKKWGFRIARASQFSVPAGDMRQRAAYSAITICQLLALSIESGN